MADDNTGKPIVGAREKLATARFLNSGGTLEQIVSKREGRETSSALPTVVLIFCICLLHAYILGQVIFTPEANITSGIEPLDMYVLASKPAEIVQEPTIDMTILMFTRAFILFLLAGIPSFLTWLWFQILDKTTLSPLRTVWGVIALLPVIILGFGKILFPLLDATLEAFAKPL